MNALVVYESMYGNTRRIAEAVARGLGGAAVQVGAADPVAVAAADLLVVGCPTHVMGLSRPKTREAARQAVAKDPALRLEPDATGPGLREWLATLEGAGRAAAAFDTRLRMPRWIGHAAPRIARQLRRNGHHVLRPPASFFVSKQTVLLDGELTRAEAWGAQLAAAVARPGSGSTCHHEMTARAAGQKGASGPSSQ